MSAAYCASRTCWFCHKRRFKEVIRQGERIRLDVLYKKKRWKLISPKNLKFTPGCIRNILIEKNGEKIITNSKEVKKISKKDILSFS